MITTEVFRHGRSLGLVIWSGLLAEAPVNLDNYVALGYWSRDVGKGW